MFRADRDGNVTMDAECPGDLMLRQMAHDAIQMKLRKDKEDVVTKLEAETRASSRLGEEHENLRDEHFGGRKEAKSFEKIKRILLGHTHPDKAQHMYTSVDDMAKKITQVINSM